MGEALFELEQILRSKRATSQEANVLMNCKAKAVRAFTIGAGAGAGITWLATRRFGNLFRINLSGGAAGVLGLWNFGRSLDSCIEHILALEGSRMQKELADIMLKRHQKNPWIMEQVSKHFYSEKVYDDSSSDQPRIRWRYRNFFGDYVAHSQTAHDGDSYNEKTDSENSDEEKAGLAPKQVPVNPGVETTGNPLDCVFGVEEIDHHSDKSPQTSTRRRSRSHNKRSHRKHRLRHEDEDSLTTQHE